MTILSLRSFFLNSSLALKSIQERTKIKFTIGEPVMVVKQETWNGSKENLRTSTMTKLCNHGMYFSLRMSLFLKILEKPRHAALLSFARMIAVALHMKFGFMNTAYFATFPEEWRFHLSITNFWSLNNNWTICFYLQEIHHDANKSKNLSDSVSSFSSFSTLASETLISPPTSNLLTN